MSAGRKQPKYERNESCPCGSGKKYKKCCFFNGYKYNPENKTYTCEHLKDIQFYIEDPVTKNKELFSKCVNCSRTVKSETQPVMQEGISDEQFEKLRAKPKRIPKKKPEVQK